MPILHELNLEVHNPRTRKTYSNLYLTEPRLRIIEPLWRNIEPLCGIIKPLRRNADHLSHCGNIESVYGVNKSFTGNHNPTLRGESACQTTVLKSFTDRETVDMKAVLNDYKSSYGIIILGNCDMFDVNNDRRSNEPSIMVHRLTVRTLVNNRKSMDTCSLEAGNHPEFLSKKLSKP